MQQSICSVGFDFSTGAIVQVAIIHQKENTKSRSTVMSSVISRLVYQRVISHMLYYANVPIIIYIRAYQLFFFLENKHKIYPYHNRRILEIRITTAHGCRDMHYFRVLVNVGWRFLFFFFIIRAVVIGISLNIVIIFVLLSFLSVILFYQYHSDTIVIIDIAIMIITHYFPFFLFHHHDH